MYIYYNPNPYGVRVGDCVIRAVSKLLDVSWDNAYFNLCIQGDIMKDMPSSNSVWSAFLMSRGYKITPLPNTCPQCYTVKQFCEENQNGTYLLATGSHVVTVIDGNYYDTWDSGDEIPIYFFSKEV